MSAGSVDVLNCVEGHLTLTFDKNNPIETAQAREAVTRMLREGYWLFIEVDGQTHRVVDFDPKHDMYIIAQVPTQGETHASASKQEQGGVSQAAADDTGDEQSVTSPAEQGEVSDAAGTAGAEERPAEDTGTDKPADKKRGRRKVPASEAAATAVAPRSGG